MREGNLLSVSESSSPKRSYIRREVIYRGDSDDVDDV